MALSYREHTEFSFDGITIGVGYIVQSDDENLSGEVLEIIEIDDEMHLLLEIDNKGFYLIDAYSVYEVNGVKVGDPTPAEEYGTGSVVIPVSGGTGVE